MSVWITRSAPDNLRTARHLHALGQRPLMLPVLTTEAVAQPGCDALPDAIVFTSGHAVRHFAGDAMLAGVPVYAASALVAAAATAAGYVTATSTGGSDAALLALLGHVLAPGALVLLLCGERTSPLLAEALRARGLRVARRVVYRPVPVGDGVMAQVAAALDRIDAITVHSRGGAAQIMPMLRDAGWRGSLWCISKQAAQACADLRDVAVQTAPVPCEASLIDMIGRLRPGTKPDARRRNDALVLAALEGRRPAGNDNAPMWPGPLAG